jgi:hypothetical protein
MMGSSSSNVSGNVTIWNSVFVRKKSRLIPSLTCAIASVIQPEDDVEAWPGHTAAHGRQAAYLLHLTSGDDPRHGLVGLDEVLVTHFYER